MTRGRHWRASLLLNIIIALISIKTCPVRFWSDDDWGIANYMSGVRGSEYATPYIKFINICLSTALYGLYKIWHEINWFAVAEIFVIWLSFTVLTYIFICKLNEHLTSIAVYVVAALILLAFSSSFYVHMQFTQTAAVGSIAGITLLMYSFRKNGEQINVEKILGMLLTIISSLFRRNCFLMVLPFAFLMVWDYFSAERLVLCSKFNFWNIIKKYRKCIMLWGILFVSWITTGVIQKVSYGQKYDAYNEFNSARASVIDYKVYPYEEIADELEELGVSANDYTLITAWTFEDPEFITTDLLRKIKELEPGTDWKENAKGFFTNYVENMLTKEYIFVVVLLTICLLIDFRHMKVAFWYMIVMINAISFYFTMMGRYPTYVKIGVLFAAVCLALYETEFTSLSDKKSGIVIVVAGAVALALFPLGNNYYLSQLGKFQFDQTGADMYAYLNNRSEDNFLVPTFGAGGLPGLRDSYSVFRTTRSGTYRNVIGLGGWSTGNPDMVASYNARGIYSALRQIADENVYLLADVNGVKLLQTYLYEHTGKTSTYALTNVVYGTTIYKVTANLKIDVSVDSRLSDVSVSLNETYDSYKIEVNALGTKELDGKEFDVYYAVYDEETDTTKYYMCYDSEYMTLNETEKKPISAMIPVEDITQGKEYSINIVLVDRADGMVYGSAGEGEMLRVE